MTLLEYEEEKCNVACTEKKEGNEPVRNELVRNEQSDIRSNNGTRMCVGLTNLGNTCYMNAVLQLLFSVPSVSTMLADDERLQQTGIGKELLSLLHKAGSGEYQQLNTATLKHEIGLTYSQYMGYQQHDAHELLIELLNHIHESLRCKDKPMEEDEEEGIPADSDFVVDTSMSVPHSRKEENSNLVSAMNITPPNIPNIVDENLNSLSITPQKGRVHENLPINLMEDRRIDTTLHENIYHNIAASKPTLHEKEFSLLPDSNILNDVVVNNVSNISRINPGRDDLAAYPEEEDCSRSVDSNTAIPGSSDVNQHDLVWAEWEQHNASVITDTFFGQFVTHTTCCNCGHTAVNYAPYNHVSLPLPHATDRHIVVTWIPKLDHKPYRYLVTVTQYGTVADIKSGLLSLIDLNITTADVTIAEVYQNRILMIHNNQTAVRHVNDSRSSVYAFERFIYESGAGEGGGGAADGKKIQLQSEDTNFFSNNLDTDTRDKGGSVYFNDANIEVNIDVNENCKQFKNKLELFNPEAKIENKPKKDDCSWMLVDWTNCVICLEDFPPHLLCSHASCNMTICKECYESYKLSDCSALQCPVCQEELGELHVAGSEQASPVRWSDTPVLISFNKSIIAHPYLVELPSKIGGRALLNFIGNLVPASLSLQQPTGSTGSVTAATLYLTDGADSKTEVKEDGSYTIISLHHLVVSLAEYPSTLEEQLAHITDTESLKKLEQSLKPLELQDCLNAFVKSDELCAGSTWYCAECEREQNAMTSTSISHIPPYLILQLNRFNVLNTGPNRTEKITSPVHIPRHNLDMSCITTGSNKHTQSYSLCGIIHHSGGIGGGHYTAQTLIQGTWRYYNDTSVSTRDPITSDNGIPSNDSDARSAYVLLYRQDAETSAVS